MDWGQAGVDQNRKTSTGIDWRDIVLPPNGELRHLGLGGSGRGFGDGIGLGGPGGLFAIIGAIFVFSYYSSSALPSEHDTG